MLTGCLEGWWPVSVLQHRIEGPLEVVGENAAEVLLRHGNEAGDAEQQQQHHL